MSNGSDKGTEGFKPKITHINPSKVGENATKKHKSNSVSFEGPPKKLPTIPSIEKFLKQDFSDVRFADVEQPERQATQPEKQTAQQKLQRVLREQPHADLVLLGASQSEIDFIEALEAGEIEGDTPLLDEAEINKWKKGTNWLEETKKMPTN